MVYDENSIASLICTGQLEKLLFSVYVKLQIVGEQSTQSRQRQEVILKEVKHEVFRSKPRVASGKRNTEGKNSTNKCVN